MRLVTELMMECTDVLPRRETVCIEKMMEASVALMVVSWSWSGQLRSLAMVVTIEFGGAQRGGMPLFKMSINALYFPTVIVRE